MGFDTTPRLEDRGSGGAVLLLLALSACAAATSTAPLENTYWKLLRAGSVATVVQDGEREPHLVLHPARREPHLVLHPARAALAGHTGCNRIAFGYVLSGAEIVFARPVPLPAACKSAAATRQEALMLRALERTARWRVAGERMDLLDSAGQVLASFESVYLR